MHWVLLITFVIAGCATGVLTPPKAATATLPAELLTGLGMIADAQCATGQIAVRFHWSLDPRYDNVHFIRSPGYVTRCLMSGLALMPSPGATVGLVRRDGELVAVAPPPPTLRKPQVFPAKRERMDCPPGLLAVSYRGFAPPPTPGSTRRLPYGTRVDCLPFALKHPPDEEEFVEVSRQDGALTITSVVHHKGQE